MFAELATVGRVRPRCCLKLGPQAAVWAEAGRWFPRREERSALRALPVGLLRPSPVEPNVSDMASLKQHLDLLVHPANVGGAARRRLFSWLPRPVTLLLPDLCVRAAILRLESLPVRQEEQAGLIRWRAAQEQMLPVVGTEVVYQVLPAAPADGMRTVLAVAIHEPVLRQFETVCEAVALNPLQVETVTLRLFNFWGRTTGWLRRHDPADLLWVSVLDEGLTVLIVHQGQLAYFRTKLLPHVRSPQSDPLDFQEQIVEDVVASVEACADAFPALEPKQFVLACDLHEVDVFSMLKDALAIEGDKLDWRLAQRAGWQDDKGYGGFATIPAVAGVLGEA